jgi:protein-L-isoaspartate(D-aspartate) O-methyltransferase
MNIEQARFNMVEQQIRSSVHLRQDVRELLFAVPREDFVPAARRHLAFADAEIPLGDGATMLPPRTEARAIQALGLKKHEKVLEVGAGSGYMAALLAVHAERVTTIEIVPRLADLARGNLHRAGIGNVTVVTGDGLAAGPADSDSVNAIMVSGGLGTIPGCLLARLKMGGRLFAFVGDAPVQTACLATRVGDEDFRIQRLFEGLVAPLRNAPAHTPFAL